MADLLVQYPAGTVWPHIANRLKTAAPNLWGTFVQRPAGFQAEIESLVIRLYKSQSTPYDTTKDFTCSVHEAVYSGGWILGAALDTQTVSNALISPWPGNDITFTFSNITIPPSTTYAFMYSYANSDAAPNDVVIVATSNYDSVYWFTTYYGLQAYNYLYTDAIGTWSLDTGKNTWLSIYGTVSVSIPPGTPDDITPFPPDCCSSTENDLFWQPGVWSGDVYTDPYWGSGYVATGGGRWGRQLVVAGDNSVWYEALT